VDMLADADPQRVAKIIGLLDQPGGLVLMAPKKGYCDRFSISRVHLADVSAMMLYKSDQWVATSREIGMYHGVT
jgi:hypothetical protein